MMPLKVKMWAVVDSWGDIQTIKHLYPDKVKVGEVVIPVTIHMGHTWLEGFGAWWAAFKANIGCAYET